LSGSESKTQLGWTAGGGFEFALSESVSLKGEYLHIDLGSRTILLTTTTPLLFGGPATATTTAKFDNAYDIVRAGLNVRF
jgi:outer membrane immunogenic protein